MNYKELLEQAYAFLKSKWDQFTESPTYNQLMDRYENMTPAMQRLTVVGLSLVGVFLVLAIPLSDLSGSGDAVTEFEDKRNLIRDLLKASREVSEVPDLPKAPLNDALQEQINSKIKMENIYPEQIKGVEVLNVKSSLMPSTLVQGGMMVHLAKLNLRQIVDVGYQLANLSPSVKMKDISISPNQEDSKYMDVIYKLVALAVPDIVLPPAAVDGSAGGKNRGDKKNDKPNMKAISEEEE